MRRTNFMMACALAATTWGLGGSASAQVAQSPDLPATRDTYFTFSQPVMVPNQTLPAGKYLFRVNTQNRNVVEIYAADKSRMIQRVLAVHAARSDSPERAEIRLIEGSSEAPVAIGTWWYPLQRQGWEFVYPREQALKLAKTASQPILTTAENVPADRITESSDLVRVEPSGSQTAFSASDNPQPVDVRGTAQVGEADANANRVAAAMNNQAGSAMADTRNQTSRTALPRTASTMPAIALVSVLVCAAALVLGRYRRQA